MAQSALARRYDPARVAAVFSTAEVGIDPEALAGVVRRRVEADPAIRARLRTRVRGVDWNGHGLDVEFENGAGPSRERYDQVVNALWEGRLAIDRSVGLGPSRPWLWRYKHYLRVAGSAASAAVPCSTIVLGPFGDVVVYGNGDLYLSWYPSGMRASSRSVDPPAEPAVAADAVRDEIFAGLSGLIPSVGSLPRESARSAAA